MSQGKIKLSNAITGEVYYFSSSSDIATPNDGNTATETLSTLTIGDTTYSVEGGGGSSSYSTLTNKPSINNVELDGNKSWEDLGLDLSEYALQTSLDTEKIRATTAENTLTTNLNSEITRAKAKEDELENSINTNATSITNLTNTLNEEVETLETALNDEATTRTTNDATLQTMIEEETSRAKNQEGVLQTNIDNVEDAIPTKTSQLTNDSGFAYTTNLSSYYTKTQTDDLLNSKQDTLTEDQLASVNSGITSELVTQISTNTSNIDTKQDKLTAGDGISIENNVISATGGSSSTSLYQHQIEFTFTQSSVDYTISTTILNSSSDELTSTSVVDYLVNKKYCGSALLHIVGETSPRAIHKFGTAVGSTDKIGYIYVYPSDDTYGQLIGITITSLTDTVIQVL